MFISDRDTTDLVHRVYVFKRFSRGSHLAGLTDAVSQRGDNDKQCKEGSQAEPKSHLIVARSHVGFTGLEGMRSSKTPVYHQGTPAVGPAFAYLIASV